MLIEIEYAMIRLIALFVINETAQLVFIQIDKSKNGKFTKNLYN